MADSGSVYLLNLSYNLSSSVASPQSIPTSDTIEFNALLVDDLLADRLNIRLVGKTNNPDYDYGAGGDNDRSLLHGTIVFVLFLRHQRFA